MSFTKKHDPKSSRFSYLRHFAKEKFQETCTVAIGYSEDLSEATDQEIKIFLTSKEQKSNKHFAARVFSYVSHRRQNKTVFGSKVGIKSHFQLMFLMLNGSLCLSIVLTLFSAAPSYAKDWYVSPKGSDSQSGTIGSPFLTITRATWVAKPGDTIMLRGGTYLLKSSQRIDSSGSLGLPITVQSYPGEWAILNAQYLASGTDAFSVNQQYINLRNFEIANSRKHGLSIWGGKHIVVSGLTVRGSQRSGIFMGHSNPWTVNDVKVEKSTIFNNGLSNSTQSLSGWSAALGCNSCTNIMFENNTVYKNYGEGLNFNQVKGGIIRSNKAFDNFSVNLYLDRASRVIVERNFLYTTEDSKFFRYGKSAAQIQIANEDYNNYSTDLTITGNILFGGITGLRYSNWGAGGGLRNTLFANNTIYARYGSAEYLINIDQDWGHSGTRIANNIFHYTGGGWGIVRFFDNSGISWDHNCWYGGSAGTAASNTDISGNPMLVNPGSSNIDDYRLTVSSPCRKTGDTILAASIDFAGIARTIPYDMGAYAY